MRESCIYAECVRTLNYEDWGRLWESGKVYKVVILSYKGSEIKKFGYPEVHMIYNDFTVDNFEKIMKKLNSDRVFRDYFSVKNRKVCRFTPSAVPVGTGRYIGKYSRCKGGE